MTTTLKKVRQTKDKNFTVKNLIDVYLGDSDHVKHDNSFCQRNKFYQDFCKDDISNKFSNKMKISFLLWGKK